MIELIYIVASTFITGALGAIWDTNGLRNLVIKIVLLVNGFIGAYLIFTGGLLG